MFLTVSKRLEFSASRRLYVPTWSDAQNLEQFGAETASRYGTGRNYVAFFIFTGEVNRANGMLINISAIKERVEKILHTGFDHKFLNEDQPAFAELPATAENIAAVLFETVGASFQSKDAKLVACHLVETPDRSATYYEDSTVEANYWMEFSAARQTMSPHLSARENAELFGRAASPHGHGHHYRARFTFREKYSRAKSPLVSHKKIAATLASLQDELDHRNLNREVSGLTNRPVTTESLAQYIFERAHNELPLQRIRLHEREDFFAEYWAGGNFFLGMRGSFSAAHRLHAVSLSEEANRSLYGKCNNPRGHGHLYRTEATVGGAYDERTGTLYDFAKLRDGMQKSLQSWEGKHLDLETTDFEKTPSTGENIVRVLWPKLDAELNHQLVRLRLWETPNNRFTLRRAKT